ncbi:hypothetical protein EIP86_008390 [Pleurotus ostreatoroseus]|nr:hypothetical protein EIP86_008390 [Pleurotus ostreatoroseus]
MPPPRTFIVGASSAATPLSPLDDDDDICPVCDGECTCRSRAGPSTARPVTTLSLPSTSATTSSLSQKQRHAPQSAPYPLKIKLTVPPNLRFRKYTSSDDDDDSRFVPRPQNNKARRDHSHHNKWEIKPRKTSVGPEEVEVDAGPDSDASSDQGADDEDDGNEEDDEAESDNELDSLTETEDDEPVANTSDGKLGVSFGGVPTGWSEDEESSFDADVFFAALDDSSDSCSSPPALRNDAFASDFDSDVNASFSADEEDALLLMNVDPSVHVRRTAGEFEVGVELDGLSFGWDGQLVLPPHLNGINSLDLELYNGSTESDVDMTVSDGGSSTEDQGCWSGMEALALDETDGETTEDELVDSDGLPNPRAMMLFRWPPAVSAIDPASTMSPSSPASTNIPLNTTRTTRIALATISAQRGSPAPSPADILAGKVSMDDLDDIEINDGRQVEAAPSSSSHASRYAPGVPTMGHFVAEPGSSSKHAVIDGHSDAVPSPFPRSRIIRVKPRSSLSRMSIESHELSTDAETLERDSQNSSMLALPTPLSSDDISPHSQIPTSDGPSSTEAIDLDDVLDPSFMDSDPMMSEPETPVQSTWIEPRILNRWDRIPVATFRRTRETSLLEGTTSDTSLGSRYTGIGHFVQDDMLGTPKTRGGKKSSNKRSKGRRDMLVVSPVLLPIRDEELTPTHGTPRNRFEKSRKELRKEKAMMKRKMAGKNMYSSQRHQQHHHHHHHPNMKMRGTNSVQRTHSSSSHVPRLNL